jgi:hypothetical protein
MRKVRIVFIAMLLTVCFPLLSPAAQWTQVLSSTEGTIHSFAILSATQVWAGSSSGYIYFYNGETIGVQTNLSQGFTVGFYGMSAVDSEHVWAAGYSGSPAAARVYRFDGTQWTEQLVATNNGITQFLDIYAADTQHVWAAGNSAQIWYSDDGGTTWTAQYDHANNKIWKAIDGVNASNVWTCGYDATLSDSQIMYYNGSSWNYQYSQEHGGAGFMGLDAVRTNHIWVVGGNTGVVMVSQGGVWTTNAILGSNTYNHASISENKYGETWMSFNGAGVFELQGDEWVSDTNLGYGVTYNMIYELEASPWYVWEYDFFRKLHMLDLRSSIDRMGYGVGFSWNSVPGREYQIEWTDDPLTQNWQKAETVIATEDLTYWADIGDGTSNRPPPDASGGRSYRVVEPD